VQVLPTIIESKLQTFVSVLHLVTLCTAALQHNSEHLVLMKDCTLIVTVGAITRLLLWWMACRGRQAPPNVCGNPATPS
jgi:hypothetical protein